MNGPLGNAFAALAAKLNNREADLAWPERSKGTKVPAYEKAASSLSSTSMFNVGRSMFDVHSPPPPITLNK
jgi:hypothetical protein